MSDLVEAVREHVSAEEVVEICRDLVRAPSPNPPGDEREVAKVAESWLDRLGLPCERVEAEPGRVSLVSSWGRGNGKTLLFNGHYDVVPVDDAEEWPHPPYEGRVADGKLYGRGSTDMKAGIASCLAAVAGLQRAGVEPDGKLRLQFVADEEALGSLGTKVLVDSGYCDGVDEAVVGEPTDLHLVTAERGAAWFKIVTEGVSAHGSTPQLGTNAIEHMAKVIPTIAGMRFRKLHELLGAPTVNVGMIRGGSKVNMVPDHCEIEIDRRTIPGETEEEVLGEFEAVLDDLRSEHPDLKARIADVSWAEPCECPEGATMVSELASARDDLRVEGSELGYMGATDARFLITEANIPTAIFGPGDVRLAHTRGENVRVDQLADAARIYALAFGRFLGTG